MGTSYHSKRRTNSEEFEIDGPAGFTQEITLTLQSYSAPTEEESDKDSASLRIKVDERDVLLEARDIGAILHPLIEALRLLLAAQTVNEDELDDAWTATR